MLNRTASLLITASSALLFASSSVNADPTSTVFDGPNKAPTERYLGNEWSAGCHKDGPTFQFHDITEGHVFYTGSKPYVKVTVKCDHFATMSKSEIQNKKLHAWLDRKGDGISSPMTTDGEGALQSFSGHHHPYSFSLPLDVAGDYTLSFGTDLIFNDSLKFKVKEGTADPKTKKAGPRFSIGFGIGLSSSSRSVSRSSRTTR